MPERSAVRARLDEIDRTGLRAEVPAGPQRTCIGCRRTDSRSVLLRVVAESREDGPAVVVPDPRRRLPGRGAWLHPDTACLDLAVRRRAFARALRAPVEGVDVLRTWVEEHLQVQ